MTAIRIAAGVLLATLGVLLVLAGVVALIVIAERVAAIAWLATLLGGCLYTSGKALLGRVRA